MTQFTHPPPDSMADRIRFACGNCGSPLEVPAALAGVEGPCPLCGIFTTAPPRENGVAAGGAARSLLAKPPPRREMPPPLAPVEENRPVLSAVRPVPIAAGTDPAIAPAAQTSRASRATDAKPPGENPAKLAHLRPEPRQGPPSWSGKSLRGNILLRLSVLDRDQSPEATEISAFPGVNGHEPDDVQPPAPALRRHGWRRWMDIAIVSVFTGLLLATVAALRFTAPVKQLAVPGLPDNLNELVERETQSQRLREQEAGTLACATVNRYLGAASEQAAASYLLPPPEGIAAPAFPPFPALQTAEWEPALTKRIPFTDRHVVTVQPKDSPGPVFIVEHTESGPRLHAGPVTQQSAGLFEKFTSTPGEGEAVLYVEVCPTPAEGERSYRAQRPDLAAYRFVDVRNAFPAVERKEWIFCLQPGCEAARTFARYAARDPGWRRTLVQVRWHQHREAGPWAELVKFIPGAWSGDPPAALPSATASTSP